MISRLNRNRLATILRPPERLSISEWAGKHAWIPEEGNAEPGRYRLSRMPHQAAMLDDPIDPGVREVFWMMASQFSGKTLMLIFIVEFCIAVLRKSVLMSRDTKDRAVEWMRDKFLPTARATPLMNGLLREPRKRDSESTVVSRKFPGGVFKIIGAKSRGAFRSGSAGKVFQDEIDAYEATKEGDPCALIDRAAKTFSDSWKIKSSTTTLKDFSRIHKGFLSGDQQYYFLPCPICGVFQYLKDEQLKFSFTAEEAAIDPLADPTTRTWTIGKFPIQNTRRAIYVCEHCHRGWSDMLRVATYMSGHVDNSPVIVNGKELRSDWQPTAPFNGVRSRSLSGMYATIGLEKGFDNYLHQFAQKFLDAKHGGRETLMAWMNMFANKPFEDEGENVDWKTLIERAEDYEPDAAIPPQVVWINFGADIHPDRVEILFFGWGEGQETWVLSHHVIFGDFDMPTCQERVWDYLTNKKFNHPILGPLPWSAGGIDSGHQTKVKAVYQFCAKHRSSNVFSVKGFEDVGGGAVYERKNERVYGGTRLNLNTDYLKTLIFDRLRNKEPGPRFIHFPKERRSQFGTLFYNQLCSEKRIPIKMPKGGYVMRWVKLTATTRNEILDMFVYAYGVSEVCRQEEWIARKWKMVRDKIKEQNPPDAGGVSAATVNQPKEAKVPEMVRPPQQHRRPGRRKFIIGGSPFTRRF